MQRGKLSNRPAPVCALDYRVIIEPDASGWWGKIVPRLMLEAGFGEQMLAAFPIKEGAAVWLERNWEIRILVYTIGVPHIAPVVDMVAGDLIAEIEHFDDREQFRTWLRRNTQVHRVYTVDPTMVGLDHTVQLFSSWADPA